MKKPLKAVPADEDSTGCAGALSNLSIRLERRTERLGQRGNITWRGGDVWGRRGAESSFAERRLFPATPILPHSHAFPPDDEEPKRRGEGEAGSGPDITLLNQGDRGSGRRHINQCRAESQLLRQTA